ncbi:isoprenylcysteine carboxylmethyltransferase family protein [Pseudoflavitalea sp. X16]|nr:isoprenylcysteine carboxylmethyltransferase family protein [Paraflavitalea devenefica]
MHQPSLIKHLRDILILPFTVTVIAPWFIYNPQQDTIPANMLTKVMGLLFLAPGVLLFFYTVFLFRKKGKGTLAPWTPTQKLVITGPYRYCRNPMITGVFFILIGEALFFHSLNILIWAFIFFTINTVYFIVKEEPDLYKRFGEEYKDYKEKVPRWIPKMKPYQKDS